MTHAEPAVETIDPNQVAVVGVPLDENSSLLRGPALAPPRIRAALRTGSMNLCAENGLELGERADWHDIGDLTLGHGAQAMAQIEEVIGRLVQRGVRVLALGGDHSISYPLVRAHAAAHPALTVLHIDAHPDLYAEFDDNRYSHASPFARIMEDGLVSRLVQVGIRAMNAPQRMQAERFGVEVITMRDNYASFSLDQRGPIYVSLDLDALDPAFAPGVSHHEPGGMSVREVLALLERIDGPVVGADIVEYNPVRDYAEMTATVAAKFYKEFVARLLDDR